ncbi:hypothetical protein ACOMHN_043017 [Nucella lapillus]
MLQDLKGHLDHYPQAGPNNEGTLHQQRMFPDLTSTSTWTTIHRLAHNNGGTLHQQSMFQDLNEHLDHYPQAGPQ